MFYLVEFDAKPGIQRSQITDAYKEFASYYEKALPQFKFLGLYARNVLLGSRPHYLALWEFQSYADLDKWNEFFYSDEEGRQITRNLADLGINWGAKILSKLI